MASTAKHILVDLKDADLIKLDNLPGLYVASNHAQAFVDGVAAASARIGRKLPLHFSPFQGDSATDLRDYQRDGVSALRGIMRVMGGALLADDVGLGKTRQAIAVGKHVGGRKLVVCPAYVRETWREELTKCALIDVAVLGPGTSKATLAEWAKARTAHWVITSYELAPRAYSEAFVKDTPALVIMDEAHMLKGRWTKRSKGLEEIARMCSYRLAITATPMWSRPRDFHKLLDILFPKAFGSSWDFDHTYCGAHENAYGGLENSGATNTEELKLRLSYYMVRREKGEVLKELPPLTRQVVWLDPPPEAEDALKYAMANRSRNAMQLALKSTLDSKKDAAVALAVQAKRFLLFTWMRDDARELAQRISNEGAKCYCITGEDSHQLRASMVQDAKRQGWGIVATMDSLGAGVNLQGVASYGIFHALDWVPVKLLQAEGRLHRMGQTEPVQWVYLACKESMDAHIIHTVVDKLDAFRKTVGASESRTLSDTLGDNVNGAGLSDEEALANLYKEMT